MSKLSHRSLLPAPRQGRYWRGLALPEVIGLVFVIGVLVALGGAETSSLRADPRTNSNHYNAQSFHVAVQSAHQAWQHTRQGNATIDLSGFGNGALDFNAAGYPVATGFRPGDTIDSAMTHLRCAEIFNALMKRGRASVAHGVPDASEATYVGIGGGPICIYRANDRAAGAAGASAFVFDVSSGELWYTDIAGARRHLQCPAGLRPHQNESGDPASYCAG